MKIRVRVHAGARTVKTEPRGDDLHVWVNAPPVDGRANRAVAEVLGELYRVPPSAVRLVSGAASRSKTFEIEAVVESKAKELRKSPPSAEAAPSSKASVK